MSRLASSISPIIRKYHEDDEEGWVRCRVLAFLDSAYYDNVYREKETYSSKSIELVAEIDGAVIGLLDVECEDEPQTVCSKSSDLESTHLAGMIWHIAVHPDFRRKGIAHMLLERAIEESLRLGLSRLEAWTRDDGLAEKWYLSQGFNEIESYYHVYIDGKEMKSEVINSKIPELKPISVFAHYLGDDNLFLNKFNRVYKCIRFDLAIE